MRIGSALAAVMCVCAAATTARANGRFPVAQHVVVGPGARSDVIILRATFGLLVSRDGGATFRWVCEEAMNFSGVWDPPVALGADGAIFTGSPTGLLRMQGCAVTTNASVGAVPIADLDHSADGMRVIGVPAQLGQTNRVFVSSNAGVDIDYVGTGFVGATPNTLEMAPSRTSRIYVSATNTTTRAPVLYRSDDGGAQFQMLSPDFHGGEDAWIAGVDPTNPDVLYVRSNSGAGTLLLRSSDAGDTLQVAASTTGSMLGFAISSDGQRVWYGGPTDGLYRSSDGAQSFEKVADRKVLCLRHHAGALYICGDWITDFGLARWADGDASLTPMLYFQDVAGPASCTAPADTWGRCVERWPMQRSVFGTRDAGVHDGGAADAGNSDAGSGLDGGDAGVAMQPQGTCRCAAPGSAPLGAPCGGLTALCLLALCSRKRPQR